jgi:ATP synthase protein I
MRKNDRRPLQAMALYGAILSQLVGSILAGLFLGRWMDQAIGTFPLFLIVGLLLGLATGVYSMLRLIRHFFSGE